MLASHGNEFVLLYSNYIMKIILRKRKMKKIEAMVIRERVWYTGKRRDRGERSDVFMAKTEKQKLKLLYIMQYLMERTDEDHMVTTQDIIGYLEQCGIHAERKSIYTDIDQLMEFGLDIIRVRERPGGYYLASRQFELAELKLLVDAVQASRFITARKSGDLIRKLESLCSKEQARQLHRQVVVTDRNKAANEGRNCRWRGRKFLPASWI